MKQFISASLFLAALSTLTSCSDGGGSNKAPEPAAVSNATPSIDTSKPADTTPVTAVTGPAPVVVPAPVIVSGRNENITVDFVAKVGGQPLVCSDKTADAIAQGQIFTDVRIFLSNISLIDEAGKETRLDLSVEPNSSNLQFVDKNSNSIALLNFLDPTCAGSDATKTVKTQILGSLPQGSYKQLSFQIGLPYPAMDPRLAAIPAALAPSDMGWMWEHYPADLQVEAFTGAADGAKRKVLNALTSAKKQTIVLPLSVLASSSGQTNIAIELDLGKLFVSDAQSFLSGLEAGCNNSTTAMSEAFPNCANAYKAFGLEVSNPKEAYNQTVFSVAP